MPQPQTTHKDLHRAAMGSVFSLVYLMVISPGYAENPPPTASANLTAQSGTAKLVKNEPAKVPAAAARAPAAKAPGAAGSINAQVKPIATPTAAIPVPQVKTPPAKGGKLREIPLSTLNADKANTEAAKDTKDTKNTKNTKNTKDKSGTSKTDGKIQAEKPSQNKPAQATAVTKRKSTTASIPRLNNGLIPPPPPIVPIGMDVLGMYAQPVDYLSLKELEGRKKELTARFNELDSTVSDGERQIRERKERADLFESLYQEGVVSRKELETARREAGEIDRDLKFKQDELESVKISMKAVNNRLAVLKKMEAKMNAGKKSTSPKSAKKR